MRAQDQRIENTRENHPSKRKAYKSDEAQPLGDDAQAGHSHAASLFSVFPGDSKDHNVIPQNDRISKGVEYVALRDDKDPRKVVRET